MLELLIVDCEKVDVVVSEKKIPDACGSKTKSQEVGLFLA